MYRRYEREIDRVYAVATNIRVQSDSGSALRIHKSITVILNEQNGDQDPRRKTPQFVSPGWEA
jgi:hypothetical protein